MVITEIESPVFASAKATVWQVMQVNTLAKAYEESALWLSRLTYVIIAVIYYYNCASVYQTLRCEPCLNNYYELTLFSV